MAMRPAQVVIDHVKKLNLYKTSDDDTIEERRNQIISTRIFIILFLISLTGLIGYASLSLQTTTVRVQFPTQTIFEELYSLYPETLVCPCTRTSIQMDAYTHIEVTYHQVIVFFRERKQKGSFFLLHRFVQVCLWMVIGFHQYLL